MNHHELFSDKSDLYKQARPSYPSELFTYLTSLCEENNRAWDCACGSGQAAQDLAKNFTRVYATDVSKQQISNANPHSNIQYSVSKSENTCFENESFDLICVAQALHWFNFELFWPEVQRVLKPKGIFTALAYNLPSISNEIDACIQAHILDVVEPYWAQQNQLIWNHYKDINFPFKKVVGPTFDMKVNWNLDQLFAFIHTFSATRRCMDDIGDDFFQEAYSLTNKLWGDSNTKKSIAFDFFYFAGRKT